MEAENLSSDIITHLNAVMCAPDAESQIDRFIKFLPILSANNEVERQKFDLLNRLEMHRDLAIDNNNLLKEVIAYLTMLKLSSKLNLFEVEEKLHSNFEIHTSLQHDSLVKLIAKLENKDWRDKLNLYLDEIEKSIVRIAPMITGSTTSQAVVTPRGSAMSQGIAQEKTIDPALLAKITEYKRIIMHDKSAPKTDTPADAVPLVVTSKLTEFFALTPPEKLWFIAEEVLRRVGLTDPKRRSILPYEMKLNDPGLLEGSYSDTYIAAANGLWKISQRLINLIKPENPNEIAGLLEQEVDRIIGQIALCQKNRYIFGLIERNRDFMPTFHITDQLTLNAGNTMFNERMGVKGSMDDAFPVIQLALQTIGEHSENDTKTKKFFYKITGSKLSLPSQIAVIPRNPIPMRENEYSYFV